MPKGLAKRTTKQTASKVKEVPEPETFEEKGPVNVAEKEASFLGKCISCNYYQANSRADNLCLDCHKKKNGYMLDEAQNRYVKEKKK